MSNGENIKVPFLKVPQGDLTFYVSSVPIGDVLKICKPLDEMPAAKKELSSKEVSDLEKALQLPDFNKEIDEIIADIPSEPYQRVLNESRAKKIARYLNEAESVFPNSIILAINPEISPSFITEDGQEKLSIPANRESAVILDGQHRIAAFKYVDEEFEKKRLKNFNVVVTFLYDIPFYLQAEIFAVINGTQTKVNRSIVYSLLGYRNQSVDIFKGEMAAYRFSHYITKILDSSKVSPWYGLIKMRGTGKGVVTQAAMIDHLKDLLTPKVLSSRLNYYPVLYSYYKDQRVNELSKYLIIYFSGIKSAWKDYWGNGTSLLCRTNGIAVMFRILHDLVIAKEDLSKLGVREVEDYWKKVPEEKIKTPPVGGSKGYQDLIYAEFVKKMLLEDEVHSKREAMKKKLQDSGGLI